jgi:hypothetical protein
MAAGQRITVGLRRVGLTVTVAPLDNSFRAHDGDNLLTVVAAMALDDGWWWVDSPPTHGAG